LIAEGTFAGEGIILNVNKPSGMTSFDVIRRVRRHVKGKKIGHAGTLDPFAAGVLLILVGRATKRFEEFNRLEKEYLAEIQFGMETDTLDVDGKVVAEHPIDRPIAEEDLEKILKQFLGEIEQIPPLYSALKVRGKPLYKYARKGVEILPRPRKVQIHSIRMLHYCWPSIWIEVICSRGTYVRALARDIGKAAGTGAYLKSLIRTRVGPYRIEDAVHLDRLLDGLKEGRGL